MPEGIFVLAVLLVLGLPFALLKLAIILLKLLVTVPYGLFAIAKNHAAKSGPREAALSEAAHGAAMIVLPVVVLLRHGGALPSWSAFVALPLMLCGGFWLFNGAKFSVGWRDPKLLARAAIKIAVAVWLFRAIDQRQWWIDPAVDAVGDGLLSLLGWFLLVTGVTKLFLVLRGLPSGVNIDPGSPHGPPPVFANPSDAAKGLKK